MSLVRHTSNPNKGCGAIVNEATVKDRLSCGMKSIHYDDRGKVQYYLCEDCHLKSLYPEEIQTKRG